MASKTKHPTIWLDETYIGADQTEVTPKEVYFMDGTFWVEAKVKGSRVRLKIKRAEFVETFTTK